MPDQPNSQEACSERVKAECLAHVHPAGRFIAKQPAFHRLSGEVVSGNQSALAARQGIGPQISGSPI